MVTDDGETKKRRRVSSAVSEEVPEGARKGKLPYWRVPLGALCSNPPFPPPTVVIVISVGSMQRVVIARCHGTNSKWDMAEKHNSGGGDIVGLMDPSSRVGGWDEWN